MEVRAQGAAGSAQLELEVCRWTLPLTHTPPALQDSSRGGAGPTSHRYTCRGADLLESRLLLGRPHLSVTWRFNQSSVRSGLQVLSSGAQHCRTSGVARKTQAANERAAASPHLSLLAPPPSGLQRRWEAVASSAGVEPAEGSAAFDFSVVSYNVLSQELLEGNAYLYRHCHPAVLPWSHRLPNLLAEIQRLDADVSPAGRRREMVPIGLNGAVPQTRCDGSCRLAGRLSFSSFFEIN